MSTRPPSPDPLDTVLSPASPPMSPLVYRTPVEPPGELPVLSNRAIAWAAVVLIVLGVGLAQGLLVALGNGQHPGRPAAIKAAGTIVVGTGGAAALWLIARRQRTSELSLNQARAAHAATVADATSPDSPVPLVGLALVTWGRRLGTLDAMGTLSKTRLLSMMLVLVGALLVAGTPAVAAPARTQLQRDLDALRDLGITGALARLETADGVQTARSGVADLDSARPVPGNPFLRAGSVTKTFVATVMLQLVAEGRLSLSDPVERWLPGVVAGNGNDGRQVTVRQLLQQTSGLYDYAYDFYPSLTTPEGYLRERWRVSRPEKLVALAMRHAPAQQVWAYSNTNYVLAGMVIQAVTGRDWTNEVRERIIAPLRLRGTTTPGTWPFLPHPHARNYHQWTPGGPLVNTTITVRMLDSGADGSIISTAEDLNIFIAALVSGRLLPAAQLADMQTLVDIPPDARGHTGYGLGLYHHPLPCGGGSWTHGGNGLGYNVEVLATDNGATLTIAEFSRSFDPDLEDAKVAARRALIDRALCG